METDLAEQGHAGDEGDEVQQDPRGPAPCEPEDGCEGGEDEKAAGR
jgi:hypothetical protein